MSDDILVQRDAPVATITFNRPAQRNAVSYVMWLELHGILESLDSDPEVRAIVVTGAGDRAFSAGADISDFDEHRADGAKAKAYNEAVDKVLAMLADMGTPTISMIRGFAVGGGCELAVATDLRIASEDSRMGIPAARLGITIGHQEMQGLVNLVGKGTALYILLSARLLDAQECLRVGLVNQVVPTEELHEYTYKSGWRHSRSGAPVPCGQQAYAQAGPSQAESCRPDARRVRPAAGPVRDRGLRGRVPRLPGKARPAFHRQMTPLHPITRHCHENKPFSCSYVAPRGHPSFPRRRESRH